MKKTIVVIGAGKGLGNGVAAKFGAEGFRVILAARSAERLAGYAAEFSAQGIETYVKTADASDFEGFAAAFREIAAAYGTPDVVFYNVGVTVADADAEINARTLLERYAADTAGAYNCLSLADTPEFAAKNGAFLITGGGLALQPYAGYLPLSMDKAALRAMVLALHPVLKEKGIYLGTVQVTGTVGSNDFYSPAAIAEEFWKLYAERETAEIIH